jgi:predicted molibdopterin-dependent oxidoreductase YjgC
VPSEKGLSTGPMIEAAHRGEIDSLYNVGGNLFATMPDPRFVAEAFSKIRLRVHQDIHVNTSTLLDAGELVVLLPSQTRYEQRGGGTSTSTERRIRFSPEIEGHPQVGEARPEWEIPAQAAVAARPELAGAFAWKTAGDVRAEIGRVMPIYAGIETLTKAGDWIQWGGPQLFSDGRFEKMPDARARFQVVPLPDNRVPDGRFWLTNRRGKQFNSMIFDAHDGVQGGMRNDVFVSHADAARLHLSDGDPIRLRNAHGTFDGVARVDDVKPGHLQAYWPEINHLIARCWDPISEEPDYNTIVSIEAAR